MRVKSCCGALLWLLMTGCSQHSSIKNSAIKQPENNTKINAPTAELAYVRVQLLSQYQDWRGIPHKWGGMSKRGIDCSGLVKLTFEQQFSLSLPRTIAAQVKIGRSIKRRQLRTGDLVFFKTGINVRHVGIMVDESQFFHASTSRGVMISRLDNPYWNRHYWQSRRVNLK